MSPILENQEISKRPKHLTRRFLKQAGQPFRWVLSFALCLVVGVAVWLAVIKSPYFALQKIEVAGELKELNLSEIIKASRVPLGENLFNISLKDVEENVLQLPWVKSVSVRRQTPHALWIYVKEQNPKALLLAGGLYFVSGEGKVFKKVQQESNRDLPVLTGFSKTGSLTQAMELINFLELTQDFELFGLSEIHYNESTGFSVVTLLGPMEIKLGTSGYESKVARLKKIWPALSARMGRVRGIDLDYGDRVFIKL